MNETFARAGTEAMLSEILKKQEALDRRILTMERLLRRLLNADDNKIYSIQDAAEILGVHYNTVRRYIRNDKLMPIPGTKKITGHSLRKFIQSINKSNEFILE